MERLYQLATKITTHVGSHGSSVLIFVTGMNDIEVLCDLIESINVAGVTYTCLPIHSDIPFEEQMSAFDPPGEGEVKVVIATNAAESSVTLPDVDHGETLQCRAMVLCIVHLYLTACPHAVIFLL